MKIHEYQAKSIFKEYGISIPFGKLCFEKSEIEKAVHDVGIPCVIKAQVHSGARGKAGGVKFARTNEDAVKFANEILGMELVSSQAGAKKVHKILIEQGVDIDKELYLSLTFDRENASISLILSKEGGMDIEEVAKSNPSAILRQNIEIDDELDVSILVDKLGFCHNISHQLEDVCEKLYQIYVEKDLTLIEINPLVITKEGEVIALDAKMNFDDNALFRHPEIVAMKDELEENPLELEAQKFGLSYIKLDGTIGCMVNGAGLAMATMDVIKMAGKNAANFLDVGGGASAEKIEKAFKLLVADKNVEAVFINIFGGILRCDILAEGITKAVSSLNFDLPVIIRLEGTNKEEGAKILNSSSLKFSVVKNLKEAQEVIRGL